MKIFKYPIYSILLLAFILGVLVYTGFCFKQFRFFSDDEKIRIAVAYILEENRKNIFEYKDRVVTYPFKRVDEFFASNPISYGASKNLRGRLDWVQKACGDLSSYVTLEFIGVYKGSPKKHID